MVLTCISLGPVNCYLVRSGNVLFLIDSGNAGTREHLLSGIAAAGEDVKDIALLILTHGHSDHAGNAAWFQREHGIPVAVHKAEAAYVMTASRKIPRGTSLSSRIAGGLFSLFGRKGNWEAFKPDHLLDASSDMKAFGLDAALLELPGHTAGSIGLLFPDGNLIAGDLVTNFTKPGIGMFAEDIDRMRQDIRSLETLGVTVVYPGHGKPFDVAHTKNL